MKKTTFLIIAALIATFFVTTQVSFASNPVITDIMGGQNLLIDKTAPIENIPKNITPQTAIAAAISYILKIAIYLNIIALVVMSIYYVISMGNEEEVGKAKKVLLYLVIGMSIISGSYAISIGISKFNFFAEIL